MLTAPELLVVNTGPLIALGRVDALQIVGKLSIKFVAPSQVAGEPAHAWAIPSRCRGGWMSSH